MAPSTEPTNIMLHAINQNINATIKKIVIPLFINHGTMCHQKFRSVAGRKREYQMKRKRERKEIRGEMEEA